jgi:hypothetical protein
MSATPTEAADEADAEPVTNGKKKPILILPATAKAPNPIPVGSVVNEIPLRQRLDKRAMHRQPPKPRSKQQSVRSLHRNSTPITTSPV